MNKAWQTFTLGIVIVLLLTGCSYESLDKAIAMDIPFTIKEVIHTEEIKEGALVFYTTNQLADGKEVEALAAAFIQKSEDGWQNAGHNHWTFYENENMMIYKETFHVYKTNGELEVRIPVVFGKIHNKEITTIEAAKTDGEFTKIDIVKKKNDQFFFAMEEYSTVRALGQDDKEIDKQGE